MLCGPGRVGWPQENRLRGIVFPDIQRVEILGTENSTRAGLPSASCVPDVCPRHLIPG